MLKTTLLHPEILSVLAASGHMSRVLIADSNFPVASRTPAGARAVHLNLSPGIPSATDVLAAVLSVVPVEAARMMSIPGHPPAPIVADYRALLPAGLEIAFSEREAFYAEAASPLTSLVIATAETRRFANLLISIGTVRLQSDEAY